jgi:hypothetical protein
VCRIHVTQCRRGTALQERASCLDSYRKIIADCRRQHLHQLALRNAGDWRGDYCSRAQHQITGDRLVVWYEQAANGSTRPPLSQWDGRKKSADILMAAPQAACVPLSGLHFDAA